MGGQAAARRRVATTSLHQTVMQRADATVQEAAAELDRGAFRQLAFVLEYVGAHAQLLEQMV